MDYGSPVPWVCWNVDSTETRDQGSNKSRENENWLTRDQFIKSSKNMESMAAWLHGSWGPRNIGGEETTQRGTLVGPITPGELVV